MGAVHVGVDEPHSDRLVGVAVGAFGQHLDQGPCFVVVERAQDRAIGTDPLRQDMAVPPLDKRGG